MDREHAAASLGRELEHRLLRRLVLEWEDINWRYFKEALRPPVLELSSAETTLGMWRSQVRTIAMSRASLLTRPWAESMEVLKHEVAHQYVDEVLGGEATPHGPLFQQVCDALGIDANPRAEATAENALGGASRVISRVRKLLALAESSNQHEAELAASTAQRMMLKYNLELVESAASRDDCAHLFLGEPTGRVQAHQRGLAALLAEHYFVQAIWVPVYRPLEGKKGSLLELCGRPENLEMAEFVHNFMLRTIEGLWEAHKRSLSLRSNKDRRSFLAGAVVGFSAKLREQFSVAKEEGLVWVGDPQVDKYFRRRHPRVVSTGGARAGSADAYAHGRKAGRDIVLSQPVESRGTRAPRALSAAK